MSRRTCHPPTVFSSVAKAVATRLVTNCSLERFLIASDYSREEVEVAMEEARRLDRRELVTRPRRGSRRGGERKSVLVTTWDPRAPNMKEGLKLLEERLYEWEENVEAFRPGSVIAGFRRS